MDLALGAGSSIFRRRLAVYLPGVSMEDWSGFACADSCVVCPGRTYRRLYHLDIFRLDDKRFSSGSRPDPLGGTPESPDPQSVRRRTHRTNRVVFERLLKRRGY